MSNIFHKHYVFRNFLHTRFGGDMEKAKAPAAKPDDPPADPPADPPTSNSTGAVRVTFAPSNFDKKILVWAGRYKSESEIPARITYEALDNARSRVRIKVSNLLILGTVVLCGYCIYRGKKSLREGDTIRRRVLERDEKMLEEYRKAKNE